MPADIEAINNVFELEPIKNIIKSYNSDKEFKLLRHEIQEEINNIKKEIEKDRSEINGLVIKMKECIDRTDKIIKESREILKKQAETNTIDKNDESILLLKNDINIIRKENASLRSYISELMIYVRSLFEKSPKKVFSNNKSRSLFFEGANKDIIKDESVEIEMQEPSIPKLQ